MPDPGSLQTTDGHVADARQAEDQTLRDNAEPLRLVTQAVLQALEAQSTQGVEDQDRLARIETTLTGLDKRVGDIAQQLHQTAATTSATDSETLVDGSDTVARLRSDTRAFHVQGWRQSHWISETNQSNPLPRPRMTIVGRALSDLGATSMNCKEVTILQVFQLIHESGQHHLDPKALRKLESAESVNKTERNRATSGLTKVFNKRFEQLKKARLADQEASRRWLTSFGKDVFNDWPDWRVEHDDDECEGEARLARRRPHVAQAAAHDAQEQQAAPPEDGSVSGPSE